MAYWRPKLRKNGREVPKHKLSIQQRIYLLQRQYKVALTERGREQIREEHNILLQELERMKKRGTLREVY